MTDECGVDSVDNMSSIECNGLGNKKWKCDDCFKQDSSVSSNKSTSSASTMIREIASTNQAIGETQLKMICIRACRIIIHVVRPNSCVQSKQMGSNQLP
ncbi:hypothetical protein J6590_038268 [Homalodisca vitripennis]|nr:hypothetical protein J6590_038268 [Homalodisca vitripennis]